MHLLGLKYTPECIRVTSLNLQAVAITYKQTSWWKRLHTKGDPRQLLPAVVSTVKYHHSGSVHFIVLIWFQYGAIKQAAPKPYIHL